MRSYSLALAVVLAAVSPTLVCAQQSNAQPPVVTPVKATEQQLLDYKADNASILKNFPLGGPELVALVQALVLADPSLVDSLITLASRSNRSQSSAIGEGIGAAIREIKKTDGRLAADIAGKIGRAPNGELIAGYALGSGETPTLATPGATAGGGVGSFSFGQANGSNLGSGPQTGFSTTNFGFTSTTFSSSFSGSTTSFGGSTTSCVASVSPARVC